MPGALDGVKVLDFTWAAAGPLTIKYLADFGATVIRVESPSRPCIIRTSGPYKDGVPGLDRCAYFAFFNANKYSLSLNLGHPKAIEIVKKLVTWADVVADSFSGGTMEKWGLGYEDLKRIKPDIIMYHTSIHGQTGPHAKLPGAGTQLVGLAGFTHITGWADREPVQPHGGYPDLITPRLGAAVIIAALDYRRRTGKGQCLDISQYEAALQFLAPAILDYTVNGREIMRRGNFCPYAAPHGVYRCQGENRWCAIAIFGGEEWGAFCHVVDNAKLSENPRFATLQGRKENEAELDRLVEKWTRRLPAEEVMGRLQAAGIAAGVVQNAADLYQDSQLQERGLLWRMEHRELGAFSHLGQSIKLSQTPAEPRLPAPCLGAHTEYVLTEIVGISTEEFVELLNKGVFD